MKRRTAALSTCLLMGFVLAGPGQAGITPGKAKLGSSSEPSALTPPVRSGDRHATAASWHDGVLVQAGTINCVTGFVEFLGGSYVGWFGEVGASPVVNQTYYIRVGWGISGNPCTGGAYVHTEIQLPSFTSLAITATNKVRCFYKSPSASNLTESPSGCPQAPTSVGLYGGLSFDPIGATAWPSAFGSLFEIWIPVKTTQPLSGLITSPGCAACLFAGTWMIDGWNSPWVFPVQGVYVKQAASPPPAPSPYVDYPTPNNYSWPDPTYNWATAGYVYTEGTTGNIYTDIRVGTSGPFVADFRTAASPVGNGSWKIEQPWQLLPGTYQYRVCYDPSTGPEVCGVVQTFVRPGGVDSTAPNTSIIGKPKAFSNSKSATFTFSSNELGSTFWCKLDGGAFAECTAPTHTNLGDGLHTLLVYAEDLAHNNDLTPASYTWRVDTVKPNTKINSAPKATTTSRTAKFKFTSTEAGSTFKCKLDAKPWAACGSAKTYTNLKKGRHTLKVKSIDKAGNEDASPAPKSWRIT